MTKWQMGVLWSAPLTAAVALWRFYGTVGGGNDSGWRGIVVFSVVVAAIATASVLTTSRYLPGIQRYYGFWVGTTWWLSGLGVLFNIHLHSPENEPVWLGLIVLASMTLAIALSYQFGRRDLRRPARSQRRVVWQGVTAINQFVLVFVPVIALIVVALIFSRDYSAPAFVVPIVAAIVVGVRFTVTIFEDQIEVKSWLGIVMFRIPLSNVWTAAAVPPIPRLRDPRPIYIGLGLGWAMFGTEAVLRVTFWPHDMVRIQLEGGEMIELGVKKPKEAAGVLRSLLGLAPLGVVDA